MFAAKSLIEIQDKHAVFSMCGPAQTENWGLWAGVFDVRGAFEATIHAGASGLGGRPLQSSQIQHAAL